MKNFQINLKVFPVQWLIDIIYGGPLRKYLRVCVCICVCGGSVYVLFPPVLSPPGFSAVAVGFKPTHLTSKANRRERAENPLTTRFHDNSRTRQCREG